MGAANQADQVKTISQPRAGNSEQVTGGALAVAPPAPPSPPRPTPPDPRGLVTKTVQEHPLALLAGSLVLGIVASNLLRASLGRKVGSRLLGAVAVVGELGAKYGNKTLGAAAEAGRSGQDRLSQLGEKVGEEGAEVRRRARELGAEARRRAIALASDAAAEARDKGDNALKRLSKLGRR